MADNPKEVYADITAQNTFTDWLTIERLGDNGPILGVHNYFHVLLQGTWSGTVSVQYKRPTDADADAVDDATTFAANVLQIGEVVGSVYVRAGIKTGNFTSGTAEITVYRV